MSWKRWKRQISRVTATNVLSWTSSWSSSVEFDAQQAASTVHILTETVFCGKLMLTKSKLTKKHRACSRAALTSESAAQWKVLQVFLRAVRMWRVNRGNIFAASCGRSWCFWQLTTWNQLNCIHTAPNHNLHWSVISNMYTVCAIRAFAHSFGTRYSQCASVIITQQPGGCFCSHVFQMSTTDLNIIPSDSYSKCCCYTTARTT